MSEDIYKRLASHLDKLPGGYPQTESGVELRILRRLFTPEQANLALHLTLLPEEAGVVARRAHMPLEQTRRMLDEMDELGLITALRSPGKPSTYLATQFVVGIWERQVNRLTPELVQDFDEYIELAFSPDIWREAPQLRTIPIGASLPNVAGVMPYELAEQIVRAHNRFSVADCICRKERRLLGEACDMPLEVCFQMGRTAGFYISHGLGREISQAEALQILDLADRAGLVLQPANFETPDFFCCCCGDCCGVLRTVKLHPKPASVVSSGYFATSDSQVCSACGDCVERCQMEAVSVDDGYSVVNLDRCIGCGLCVTTCSTGAMQLQRKPQAEQRYLPPDYVQSLLYLGRKRGVITNRDLVKMTVKSKIDRLLAVRE